MLQHVIVAIIVAGAASYALWYWMPAGWRRGLAARLAGGSRRLGLKEAQAQRVAATLGAAPGCGACDSCGSCATPGQPAGGGTGPRVQVVSPPAPRRPAA
jgi:hypothetical protein